MREKLIGGSEVKLKFIPEAGKASNFVDTYAIAIDGSKWVSIGGVWEHRVVPGMTVRQPLKMSTYTYSRGEESSAIEIGMGIFVGSVTLAMVSRVMQSFDVPFYPWIFVVLGLSVVAGVSAYFFLKRTS